MSRRWRYPRSRRGSFYKAVPAAVAASAPSYIPSLQEPSGRNSRLAGALARRGRYLAVPPPTPAPVARVRRGSARVGAPRRGEFFTFPLTAVAAPAPPWVPPMLDGRRGPVRLARRGAFFAIPLVGAAPVTVQLTPRLTRQAARRGVTVRRGRFFSVPLVGTAPPAAPWVSPFLETRRAPARVARRGEFLVIPLTGAAPPPPAVPPQTTRGHVRVLFNRRGRSWVPPWPQQQAPASSWIPPVTRARRTPTCPVRRGEYQPTPVDRAPCPARITSRRPAAPLCRRGRTWRPPWVFVPPAGPGPYVPKLITSPHRPPVRPVRCGVFIEPPWLNAGYTAARKTLGTVRAVASTGTIRPTVASAGAARPTKSMGDLE